VTEVPFSELNTSRASAILMVAAREVATRGLCRGAVRNRATGTVSVVGAIMVASGVPWKKLSDDPEAIATDVPQTTRPAALLAWECVDSETGDIYAWEDDPSNTTEDAVMLLRGCGDTMAIANGRKQ
jgi:hypothetical protein